jgi:transposase
MRSWHWRPPSFFFPNTVYETGSSPGVSWIPLYEILEQRGFEVVLVNARDVHNVRGRKSDVKDCEWLQQLHSVGLLRASFRPAAAMVPLRSYLRQRAILVEELTARIQRMQKALTEMNLMLHRGQRHHWGNRA